MDRTLGDSDTTRYDIVVSFMKLIRISRNVFQVYENK